MRMRNLFVPALAIITLILMACSGEGDSLSGAKASSQFPTATPDPVSQAPAALSDLDLGSFGELDMAELTELLNSPELKDCLTNTMSLSSLLELAEREPTDADVELILPCLSKEQLDALASVTVPGLDLGSFEELDIAGLTELLNSPELQDCSADSMSLSSLLELAEREPTDADVELILPCLSGEQLDALASATASDSDLAGFGGIDIEGLMEELLNSPELMACLTSSMSLSSLLELAEREPTDADIKLILPCFSGDQ